MLAFIEMSIKINLKVEGRKQEYENVNGKSEHHSNKSLSSYKVIKKNTFLCIFRLDAWNIFS